MDLREIIIKVPVTAAGFFTDGASKGGLFFIAVKSIPPLGKDEASFPELLRRNKTGESSENSPSPILLDPDVSRSNSEASKLPNATRSSITGCRYGEIGKGTARGRDSTNVSDA